MYNEPGVGAGKTAESLYSIILLQTGLFCTQSTQVRIHIYIEGQKLPRGNKAEKPRP